MSEFMVVLASGAEHLKPKFSQLDFNVFTSELNFDEKRFFPNSDIYVKLADIEELADQRVVIIQSCTGSTISSEYFTTSDRVQELILILDTLKHPCRVERTAHKKYKTHSLKPPRQVDVVLTFQPFALQDKAFSTGESVSSRCAMNSIANLCDNLWLVEPVVHRTLSWVEELAARGKYQVIEVTQEMIEFAAMKFGFETYLLTAPDEGAQKRFKVAGFSKIRSDSFSIEMSGELDVAGKNVIVIDDLTKSGTTLLRAAEMLRNQGAADVGFVVLHVTPIRNGGEKLLTELIAKSRERIVTSNTVYTEAFCDKNPELVYNIVDKIVKTLR
jgi:phosphoribosylpyrophosphate synthetase